MTGDDDRRAELGAVERKLLAAAAAEKLGRLMADAEHAARQVEAQTGERILVRRPQVLDARRGDINRMTSQARAWLDAVAVIDRWMLPRGDQRTLGSVIKVLPPDEARLLRVHLARAGVLPDEEAA